jgi:prepilin-type N-terminal cleavage/methylation domain-containing protein
MEIRIEKKGFTLIELLVVIAIIGLLASIVLVSLNTARVKARDVKRIADLKNIQIALELYYSDHGYYPECTDSGGSNCGDSCHSVGGCGNCWGCWKFLETQYMNQMPKDPINTDTGGMCARPDTSLVYTYIRLNNGASYGLYARFEQAGSVYINYNGAEGCTGYANYKINP